MASPSMGHWVNGPWRLHPRCQMLLDFQVSNQRIPPKLLAMIGQSFLCPFLKMKSVNNKSISGFDI